jgi:hypothetical protein
MDKDFCRCQIFDKMASAGCWLEYKGIKDEKSLGWPSKNLSAGDAAIFLRDDLLRTTEQRIWGLTLTLYPTGKFNIEYDYEKPEGYEETDEVISGEEINQS